MPLSDDAHVVHLLFRELSVGRGSTATLGGGAMPKIHTVEAWDGKDGQVSGDITVVSWEGADNVVRLFCSKVQLQHNFQSRL